MIKTRINIFLFILQLIFVNTVISIFLFHFHCFKPIVSAIIFLFLLPAALLGIFMSVIKKYFRSYRTYRDLIFFTIGISAISLWLPMMIAIFTGPQYYGELLNSKVVFNAEIRDIPQNRDALWISFSSGVILYDLKGEYHETVNDVDGDSTYKVVKSFYAYPLVSEQWTFDEPIMAFFCETSVNKGSNLENWNLPYLISSNSELTKNGGLIIKESEQKKIYSKAIWKLEKTKDIRISENAIFIQPEQDFEKHFLQDKMSFYLFYLLVNIFWVGTTGVALWFNRRKTIQYVNFDIMQ